jgi:hypothetical protein
MQALTKFDLVINLKTAKALGVTTSSSRRYTWSLLAHLSRAGNAPARRLSGVFLPRRPMVAEAVDDDPYRSSAAKFCFDPQRSSHTEFLVGSD